VALAEQTTRLRSLIQASQAYSRGTNSERFLDLGVELRICKQSIENGQEFLPGVPPLAPIRSTRIGGLFDVVARKIIAETKNPVVWYLGERQAEIVLALYERDTSAGTRTLLYSAEGGGKTVLMAQGLIAYTLGLTMIGQLGAIGATAPTHPRVLTFVKALCERVPIDTTRDQYPDAWGRYFSDASEIKMRTGHIIQFRSTKKQSDATGSPVQGFTWLGSFDDELQDTAENDADPDIEARMRGARFSFRLATATAKDSPKWRAFRDAKSGSPDWRIERLRYSENPFVWPEHWERMQRNMSLREWQRRGLAMDVGPERQVYTTWEREKNLRPIPQLGARDVTAEVLAPWGPNFKVLVGHDPGKLHDVSLFLKAYRIGRSPEVHWWVVDELTTDRTTTEKHVKALLTKARNDWGCNKVGADKKLIEGGDRIFVRADPYSDSGNDASKPDKSVYTVFKDAGVKILPAAMKSSATSSGVESSAATIPKEAGIEMIVSLLCNANGDRRLFIACDDMRQPSAPRLVESIELSERDAAGKAEMDFKDESDLSHWTAALRYALYAIEKARITEAKG
jgi:hypothetical protein